MNISDRRNDDTILIDRIKFLEVENAKLSAENKQRRPVFGKLDIHQDAKSAIAIIITIALCLFGLIGGLWTVDRTVGMATKNEATPNTCYSP